MIANTNRLMEAGCSPDKKGKICRSRGGESCAFDGAMIVLQPIADTAHIVHSPIACCGNSWEGRGTLSAKGDLHRMGFTTDMGEMDIVYGGERKLFDAILRVHEEVRPKAIFVYATCVSGLIGEDLESVCRKTEKKLGIPVIPVNAPGFVGPKNLGNRIAGEVLLDHVIGTGEPPPTLLSSPPGKGRRGEVSGDDEGRLINLIGEYNIAGDLWLIEPVLKKAGFRVLSRITGDSTFEEITYAHKARLNVVVCGRALINVAKGLETRYGIPYVEGSFFGKSEMARTLRKIGSKVAVHSPEFMEHIESVIEQEEQTLDERLKPYVHLKGKKAALYTGGVKSWSFISALLDLGIEIVAVGTKKSSLEDEEKMRDILGPNAPLVEDVTPKNLKKLLKERGADILVAGGRNQYLAIKEGYPFVDVNQERHIAYAGYEGLVNLAEQISNGIRFYGGIGASGLGLSIGTKPQPMAPNPVLINPLKHSASIGAVMAFQGVHNALPIIHGAQGCSFLAKVLLTKHFREPIALASTKLFAEDVIMGSEENLSKTVGGFIEKDRPDVIGILTSGLTEVKGDDIEASVQELAANAAGTRVLFVSTPDYAGGIEAGYCKAVCSLVSIADVPRRKLALDKGQVNILPGPHLTPADFLELKEIIESFGLTPVILPDLSALDGSRLGISPLATGGTGVVDIASMGSSEFTIAIGTSMEPAAQLFKERFGIEYRVCEGIAGIEDTSVFMEILSRLSGRPVPSRLQRQRRILVDSMRDAHFLFAKKKVCVALEPDHALQTSRWITEMGGVIPLCVVPTASGVAGRIHADRVIVGDLSSIEGNCDLLVSGSHAMDTAKKLGVPLLHSGFPVYKVFGNTNKVTIAYKGTASLIQEAATLLAKEVHS